MYILYLLCVMTSFVVCSDLPLVPPSTPPQEIRGRHCRNVSVLFNQVSKSSVPEQPKDKPLKASQDDTQDIPCHGELIFTVDE